MKTLAYSNLLMKSAFIFLFLLISYGCQDKKKHAVTEDINSVIVETENYIIEIQKEGFKYEFKNVNNEIIAEPHPISGLQIGQSDSHLSNVETTELIDKTEDEVSFLVTTAEGVKADVTMHLHEYAVKLAVRPTESGKYNIMARTAGMSPSYGLADHAAFGGGEWDSGVRSGTELTGINLDPMRGYRMISNFVIFPRNGFAEINIEPDDKVVQLNKEENLQGSKNVSSMQSMYYFLGSPKKIYQSFLKIRNKEGYPVYKPKYKWFGVGWEAFGALAWNTNSETVTQNINQYLDRDFPLEWMVVGSGFWPRAEGEMDEHGTPYNAETESVDAKNLLATTSFGMWDQQLYPHPKQLIDKFHELGLKFTIGLRNGFIPGGPFTEEGLRNGYFMKNESGDAKLFKVGFPEPKVYLLDAENSEAVNWYVQLYQKWADFGVDGYKEDLFGYSQEISDDFLNPINKALMDKGVYVMGRNNYLGSPVDIHRYNDFNYNQPQDRGPINGLAYAYSGFPYVYPDIIGGTGLATGRFGGEPKHKLAIYLMRYAQYAALNPSMSFGYGPWNFDDKVIEVTRKAAQLHDRLQPYIYDAALDAYETGFPYTLTPLPLAYPDDPEVYSLADTTRRSYQWLIGESLLATPLYGNDYATSQTRDVYLPEGTWIDYESGETYQGPTTLEDFALPVEKTPLFVGNKGIVIEEMDKQLKARIYSIANQTSMDFNYEDGKTQSTITIASPNWQAPEVIDENTGKKVSGKWTRHAYEFDLQKGHDYRVE
jgi:alpha-glucosidase (family GH31 glycosyl hydrolase)